MNRKIQLGNLQLQLNSLGAAPMALEFTDAKDQIVPIWRRAAEPFSEFADSASWLMMPPGRLQTPDGTRGAIAVGDTIFSSAISRDYAIHGSVCDVEWKEVESSSPSLSCWSVDSSDHNLSPEKFPVPFRIGGDWEISAAEGANLQRSISLRMTTEQPMPAGFGDHPFWQNSPRQIPGERPLLKFSANGCYRKSDGILLPMGAPEQISQEIDFSNGRELPFELDHAFTGVSSAVEITWPLSRLRATIKLRGMEHIVIYSPTTGRFGATFALEPQTCAPNAANLAAAGVPDDVTGIQWLKTGDCLEAGYSVTIEEF